MSVIYLFIYFTLMCLRRVWTMAAQVTESDQIKQVGQSRSESFWNRKLIGSYFRLQCYSVTCYSHFNMCLTCFLFQFKEFLGTYNKLTENCFMDCVKDFTTREVKAEEVRDPARSSQTSLSMH